MRNKFCYEKVHSLPKEGEEKLKIQPKVLK